METADTNIARVQHVAKSSSDQLLSKFAEVGPGKFSVKDQRLAKRGKRKVSAGYFYSVTILSEKKSLLAPINSNKSVALIRRMGMSKAKTRAREMKNKSIITALEKTWGRAVEGASRVLLDNHYNRHKLLINDNSCEVS